MIRLDSDIEAIVNDMKPWYDNYCFAKGALETQSRVFFMAYLNLNNYYYTAPELELNHGYCDFFLLPDLTHYATKHSYILELKLIPKKEKGMTKKMHEGLIAQQWEDAEKQIKQYSEAPRVEALRQGTQLHRIIIQFDGWKLYKIDEV